MKPRKTWVAANASLSLSIKLPWFPRPIYICIPYRLPIAGPGKKFLLNLDRVEELGKQLRARN